MKNIAIIFPGQGAQKVGMAKEFYDACPHAKAIIDEADQICANGLKQVIFEGPEEKLTSTAYCQPAILTASVAMLKSFQHHPKFANYNVKFCAGLSLGEYSALCASGAMSFADTLKLVQKRALYMEEATKEAKGAMAAVIGFDKAKLLEICLLTGAEIANYNSNEQIVITGHEDKVQKAYEMIKAAGCQKVIPLQVSGAFHSSLMASAANRFAEALKEVDILAPRIPVISNVDAQIEATPEIIRQRLAKQITSSVQWVASMEYIMAQGISDFIEIGPGKVLKGLMRRINPQATVANIEKPADLDSL